MAGFTIKVKVQGFKETNAAFKALPEEATVELKAASAEIADTLADVIRAAAKGPQQRKLASTVKASTNAKVPTVTVGGSSKIFKPRAGKTANREAYRALMGVEFGMGTGVHGFKPHRKGQSYFVNKTVTEHNDDISELWVEAADAILHRFTAN